MGWIDGCFSVGGGRGSRWPRLLVILALAGGWAGPASAGGPLGLTADGTPLRWDASQTVRCVMSSGALGSRSHDAAAAILSQALQTWQQVPGSALQFAVTGVLARNVTGANVMAFLNGLGGSDASPILLDSDGSITNALSGQGASDDVFGLAEPALLNPRTGQIAVSLAVFNGALLDGFSDAFVLGTMVHELGHFANMAHSLVNASLLYDGNPDNDGLTPAMFYRGPNDPGTLSADDRAWYSWLYPSADVASRTGSIQGRVLLPDGVTGLQGIHVVARRVGDPQETAVGAVSGWQFRSVTGGVNNPAALGQYLIPNLPPGSYTVEVETLPREPVVPVPPAYLVGGPKFWHQGSSAQDAPTASSLVTVDAGQVVSGIDVVLNGDSLGDPQPVQKSGPNALPNPQRVRLPAIVSGTVDDGPAESGVGDTPTDPTAIRPLQSPNDLQDVYRVALGDWTIVTAILSAQSRAADLDLYVLHQVNGQWALEGGSTQRATPPELVQMRLPPGIHYFGVRRAGTKGSAYTLQLLASPAPEPDRPPLMTFIGYLLLGDVTATSAEARWITTDDTPSVLYYNRPQQEIGSTQPARQHALSLTGLAAAQRSGVDVFAPSPAGFDHLTAPLTTAAEPAGGPADPSAAPRVVAGSSATTLDEAGDVVMITSRLTNAGDADAHQVRIEQAILPDGWHFLWEGTTGQPLPVPLEVGDIGAGGAGAFVALIVHVSGTAKPHITLHGSYADAAGTAVKF